MGFGSSEDIDTLGAYQDSNAIPWAFAEGPATMARDFNVASQASKLGIGADGVIRFRGGYGAGPPGGWPGILGSLAEGG